MRITRTRLNQIIKEERMWLEVHTGGLGPGRNRKHDEEVRPTVELEEEEDLGMPADAEAQEADEEAAETEAAPYVTGQGIQKEEIANMVREELAAMLDEGAKPLQKLAKVIEKRGTEGKFSEWCGGKVTQACIDRAAKEGGKRAKQASLAVTFSKAKGGGPTLTYPIGDKK